MWPLFGIVTLLGAGCFLFYRRLQRPWTGKVEVSRGGPYSSDAVMFHGRIVRLRIGIDVSGCFDFAFQPETAIDRICKKLGLANEYQTGRQEFDDSVYVVSDDWALLDALARSEGLHRWVLDLFAPRAGYRLRADSVQCRGGRLWIELRRNGEDVRGNEVPAVADDVVPLLRNIAYYLQRISSTPSNEKRRDPFVRPAIFLLAISGALAVSGVVHVARILAGGRAPYIVDVQPLLGHAFVLGTLIISVLLIIAIKSLGRSARAHLVMLELMTVGYFGAVASSAVLLRDLNMEMKQAAGAYYEAAVNYRHFKQTRRSTDYYVVIDDWNNPGQELQLRVPQRFYGKVSRGHKFRVWQRPGGLGYRWVVSMEHEAR